MYQQPFLLVTATVVRGCLEIDSQPFTVKANAMAVFDRVIARGDVLSAEVVDGNDEILVEFEREATPSAARREAERGSV